MPSLHPLLPAALLLLARIAFVAADPVVAVRNGSYAGLHLPQFGQDLFLGMPYAQDAGGANRFRVPQALTETWNGTRPATNYSHACPDADPADDAVYGMSENCLSVNVVRPAGLGAEAKMPVLVWIHGGSYQQGTSGLPNYNLTYIVQRSVEIAWYNGSSWYQPIYDKIVDQVNCSAAIDTLACLRTVPYDTLYPFLNSSIVGGPGFYPTVDGDIMPAYPTELLHTGRFAHVPHLYGTNTDEGTDNAPADGTINTDADLRHYLLHRTGFNFPPATVDRLLELYPDDPAAGIPANTGAERFADLGWQYKRVAAIVGDAFYHAPRLDDARHYAAGTTATYVYRFNTRAFVNATTANSTDYVGTLAPASKGVSHFTEVAFVMGNPAFTGPWPEYRALSAVMGAQWVRFAHAGDPNGEGLPAWPRYGDGADGSNLVLQTEAQGGAYVEADTYRLAGREFLTEWARRRHV
ncbi:putative lipase 3 precursor protein [Neofusicoccum parvum UCRNP2]|uniref:Putative lipase 3 protein n=1 Tax=Botryosphaeria parva (strain UCR-NP2) TaxID=1287680 RepID=R1FVQ4_BOTPV|nr:putative lipase 3 precursor protein [Neofusicoccum parvum UCRNP2]